MARPGPAAALVLAAGRGERLGHALPKAFVELGGRSLLERSISILAESGLFELILPVIAERDRDRYEALGLSAGGLAPPVFGGEERQDSVRAGLEALPASIERVAIHDAARCLLSGSDLEAVMEASRRTGAALLGERTRDTIKRVVEGRVIETPDRRECWSAQTPQVVRVDWMKAAMAAATRNGRLGTDDVQLIEWEGHAVSMIEATHPHPKVTRPEDLLLAEALLAARDEQVRTES
jgi:2-C-methyl-D-erythritol 4-phosphate cytidylyltransferase